jgi:hypothetical protein
MLKFALIFGKKVKKGGLTPQGECTLPEEADFPCLNFLRVKFSAALRGMNPTTNQQPHPERQGMLFP